MCRKNDPPPEAQMIWEGWTRLTIVCEACELQDDLERPLIADHTSPDHDWWGKDGPWRCRHDGAPSA